MGDTSTLEVPVSLAESLAPRNIVAQRTLVTCNTDGVEGETSDSPRALKEGETAEWVLLDGVISHLFATTAHYSHPCLFMISPDTGHLREYCTT